MKKTKATAVCELLAPRHAECNERMHMLLRCGVSKYLRVEDLAAVLNSCTLLRNDSELARRCACEMPDSDWFPAVLTQLTATPSTNRRLHDLWVECDMLNVSPHMRTRTISLVALLKKRVKHWCFVYHPLNREAEGEMLCSVRPALIPVWGFGGQQRTEEDDESVLRNQLNTLSFGFGDRFTASPRSFDDGSAFGAHWEHIQVDKQSGRVDCHLCTAARHSVRFYRSQAQLFVSRFEERLRQKQIMWSIEENRPNEEVQSLSNAFYTSYFPEGAYISPDSQSWSNLHTLRHMCQHGRLLRRGPFGCVQIPEDSNEVLLRSLSPSLDTSDVLKSTLQWRGSSTIRSRRVKPMSLSLLEGLIPLHNSFAEYFAASDDH
ncbi:hypothetical protein FI667_g11859, partial [Globisporangium splendens]